MPAPIPATRAILGTATVLIAVSPALWALACGGSASSSAGRPGFRAARTTLVHGTILTSYVPPGQALRGDGDADNPGDVDGNGDVDGAVDSDSDGPTQASYRLPDADDGTVLSYGHAVGPPQRAEIASAVARFFGAARSQDGKRACALLLARVSRSVPADYGRGSAGPPYLRGDTTCAAVMTGLFGHERDELTEAVTIVGVRAEGRHAAVVVGSRAMPASEIFLERQGAGWRLTSIFASPLP
jgi:hypothetical protein